MILKTVLFDAKLRLSVALNVLSKDEHRNLISDDTLAHLALALGAVSTEIDRLITEGIIKLTVKEDEIEKSI